MHPSQAQAVIDAPASRCASRGACGLDLGAVAAGSLKRSRGYLASSVFPIGALTM